MSDKRLDLTIGVKSEGLDNFTRLASEMDRAGVEAGELKTQAAEVSAQLQAVARQQQTVDTIRQLGEQTRTLGNELQKSSGEVERLGAALPQAARDTQALADAERRAAQEVEAAQANVREMQQALTELRTGNERAARGTDEYKASVAQARSTISELRQDLQQKQAALSEATQATRTAAAAEKALNSDYETAVATAASASRALGAKRAAMDEARSSAKALGLDTGNLAKAQQQVDEASRKAQAGLDAAAASARRIQERQEAARREVDAFTADLKKLGLEGPRAPQGLEQAFRALGMGAVRQAEVEVHKLQVALAQIRNSPDLLGADKQAAVAAFNRRLAELRSQAGGATTATTALDVATGSAGNTLATAAHKAAAWGGALVGLNQLQALGDQVVQTGSQFETLQVRLENLLGGTEKAANAFEMIKRLATTTPFEVSAMTESFIKLTAMGMEPTEQQMRSLADVAANLGGGTETLSGVTLALGQAWAKGKLQGEEIMQLAERGVPIWDALARSTGRTVPELQRMAEAGALGRAEISGLIDELGRMNAGSSEKLMATYAGAVSNAKDALAEFFDMVSKAGVLDWLKAKLQELLAEFERMKQSGELQEKAKAIADAFVNLANTVDVVVKGLAALWPVLEQTAKVMLALKAIDLAGSLMASARAATALGAASTAAAAGVAATGAAGATAAAQLGTAAAAGTRMAGVLGMLSRLSLVGVVMGVAQLAAEFLRAKRAAEDGDAAVKKMLEARPASNQPKKAAEDVSSAMEVSIRKAGDLIKEFDGMIEKGGKADDALSAIGKKFDLSNAPGIKTAAAVLGNLVLQGEITSEQFNAAWATALKDVDLADFERRAREALGNSTSDTGRLQQALDAGLRESIRRAGLDFDVISGGMGQAARSAIHDTDAIISSLGRLKAQGIDAAEVLTASLGKSIDTADSERALEAVRVQIEKVRKELGDPMADSLLDQAAARSEELKDALDDAIPGINSVAEAMRRLGITSDESLKKSATEARNSYEVIKQSGTASARALTDAFISMAERVIAANNGVAPEWLKTEAAIRGVVIATDESGKSTVRAAEVVEGATGRMRQGWNGVGDAARQAGAAGAAAAAEFEAAARRVAEINSSHAAPTYDPTKTGDGFKRNADGGAGGTFTNNLPMDQAYRLLQATKTGQAVSMTQAEYDAAVKQARDAYADMQAMLRLAPGVASPEYVSSVQALMNAGNSARVNITDRKTPETRDAPVSTQAVNITINGRPNTVNVADQQSAVALRSVIDQLAEAAGRS